MFVPGGRRDDADILSAQIKCRDNKSKSAYVARTLVRERFSNGLYPVSGSFLQRIKRLRSVGLVYDLLEPYRYIIETEVLKAAKAKAPDLTAACLSGIKASMDTSVFVPSHRVHVRRKNLLHGAVLSLRSWLIGEAPRLVFPTEGAKIGGRPPAVSYRLPGAVGKLKTPA